MIVFTISVETEASLLALVKSVYLIIESAKRQKSQPIMKKKPITTEIIGSILDIHNKKDANLKNLRIAVLGSLAFAGYFRYDELCNIVPKHIEFHSDYIRIFVPRSKY